MILILGQSAKTSFILCQNIKTRQVCLLGFAEIKVITCGLSRFSIDSLKGLFGTQINICFGPRPVHIQSVRKARARKMASLKIAFPEITGEL